MEYIADRCKSIYKYQPSSSMGEDTQKKDGTISDAMPGYFVSFYLYYDYYG